MYLINLLWSQNLEDQWLSNWAPQISLGVSVGMWVRGKGLASPHPALHFNGFINVTQGLSHGTWNNKKQNGKFLATEPEVTEAAFRKSSQE